MVKRTRVAIICVILLLTMIPVSAFAADNDTTDNNGAESAIINDAASDVSATDDAKSDGTDGDTTTDDMTTVNTASVSDWTYKYEGSGNGTITNSEGLTLRVYKLYSIGDDILCISSRNDPGEFTAIDLSGEIKDSTGTKYTLVEVAHHAFYDCKKLESVILPDSVTVIGEQAFGNCHSLRSIKIPYNIDKIQTMAFVNCLALPSIELSSGEHWVISVGDNAFTGCNSLKTVIVNTKLAPWLGKDVFKFLPEDFRIHVPSRWHANFSWDEYICRITNLPANSSMLGPIEHDYEGGKCACGVLDPDFVCEITAGAAGTWQKGGNDGLSFTSNAAYDTFLYVQVDGRELDSSNYDVSEGSTVVTLKASYLETLQPGKHTIAIVSETGTATAEFTIKEAASGSAVPTGDDSNIAIWAALAGLSALGATGTIFYGRKKKHI